MIAFLLRSSATLMTLAGVAALAAGLASLRILSTASSARPIAAVVFQMAAVSVAGGLAARYPTSTRRGTARLLSERQRRRRGGHRGAKVLADERRDRGRHLG